MFLSKKRFITTLRALLLLLVVSASITNQTAPGDETPEETLSRSSRNLHQWGALSSFHGLPSERVRSITQTPDGVLWFGTENGLASFDGRRVLTNIYSNLASVPVLALKTGSDGTMWVGSENGAYYFKNGSFNLVEPTDKIPINSILVENDTVILTNPDGAVFECKPDGDDWTGKPLVIQKAPLRSSVRMGKKLLLGSYNAGLLEVKNGKTDGMQTRPRPFFINVLEKGPDGKLWLGARSGNDNSGLFASDKLPEISVAGTNIGTVNAIAFDQSGNAWVGSDERGIFHVENKEIKKRFTFASTSGSLRSDQILAVFVDREDVIWIGTDEGVNRFDPMSPRNERVSDNTQSNFVRVVAASKNGTQLAGTNRGLYTTTDDETLWKNVIADKTIFTIKQNGPETWFVGTPVGLFVFDSESGTETEILEDRDVRAVARFKAKVYVAAFGRGLIELGDESNRLINNGKVVSLFNENNERLWLATTDGKLWNFDGQKVSPQIALPGLEAASIWSITGNQKEGIWLSTNKGLFLLKDGVVQTLLQDHNVRETVLIDETDGSKSVWCATEEGLFGLKYDKEFGWISSRSDIEQGFASQNMFSLTLEGPESLIIGTNRGIVRKEIRRTRPFITANRVLSQRLHQPGELATGIILDYPQNTLSVEVTALSSRTFPEEFQYSFLLFDSNNKIIKKRFTDKEEFLMDELSPGKYRVEIRAFDRNLTVSEPLVFTISVASAPFPWIATILAVLLIIAIAALILAFFSQRKIFRTSSQLAFANKELNSARLNLANEAERERHRIARDLHDQTLADLRHLLLMADDVQPEQTVEFKSEIESISDEIRRICEDLSPSVLENIGFTAALEWELGNTVEQAGVEATIETAFKAEDNLDDTMNLSRAEQIQIYRIAQEVLNNVVRHARPSKIWMKVGKARNKTLRLEIRDDGTGFDPAEVTNKKGRGVTNIKARAQLIKAEIRWKKLSRRGTEFVLEI